MYHLWYELSVLAHYCFCSVAMCKLLRYTGLSGADLKHYAKYVYYRTAEISAIYERKLNSTHHWKQNSLFRVSYVLQCFKKLKYLFEKSQSINCTTQTVYRKQKRNKEKCCNSVDFIIMHYISHTAGNACICDKKVVHPIWMKNTGVHHVIWCNVKSHTFYVAKYDKIITRKVL